MARIANLKSMEPSAKIPALVFDRAPLIWERRNCPIIKKLITLKRVPSTSPLPMGFSPIIIIKIASVIAIIIAWEQYFFCMSLGVSIILFGSRFLPPLQVDHLAYLAVYSEPATDNSQKNKDSNEQPFRPKPLVYHVSNGKTQQDASGHGQTQLADQDNAV